MAKFLQAYQSLGVLKVEIKTIKKKKKKKKTSSRDRVWPDMMPKIVCFHAGKKSTKTRCLFQASERAWIRKQELLTSAEVSASTLHHLGEKKIPRPVAAAALCQMPLARLSLYSRKA